MYPTRSTILLILYKIITYLPPKMLRISSLCKSRVYNLLGRKSNHSFPRSRLVSAAKMAAKISIKSHFQQNASAYERNAGATATRLAAAVLSCLPLSSYTSSSHILDSAAGPGIVTKLLLSPSPDISVPGLPISPPPRVTGIDLAPAMIESFMVNKAGLDWTTAEAYVQDSQDLSRFMDGEFDAVIMNLGIFALKDPVAGAAEMYRVLKPGGYAVVTTWKVRRAADLLQGVVDAIKPETTFKPMYMEPEWTTKKKVFNIMEAGGFPNEHIKMSEANPNWVFESEEVIVETLSSPMWTAKIWEEWNSEERGRWDQEIRRQLTDEEKKTGVIEMSAWICVAQKPN
ncbi:S-adenosyl-L-methionine-dependent methyltransferase [Hypoxylon trugodes]|uniref:S-adenosyl-L-methionine-dependent methyltransferase n=1 Tax=Hypoxylon trugodes TaxID=326681 RepID=UPI00219BE0DF|nr:S-adenosyl-L-methionine-dependent methyltransferase [Hypoxylon trugodes]KAI1384531.1 S-adenosyl-L-methionine-dependent methyltransferase [Hypoxylon trugodes]